jgi:serine/threonine protein kinase
MLETQRFGKYLLYERIAVGGMAEVFRAKPAGSDKLLALKRIHPHHLENDDFVSMLIDEAKISVQLAHPNIIQVVDLGRVDHHYFIAMEYCGA